MSLQITWLDQANGIVNQEFLAVFDAYLCLTWQGNALIDASWQLEQPEILPPLSNQAQLVRDYLLEPESVMLKLNLLRPTSRFRLKVWQALAEIPVGQIRSYSALAAQLESGPRAVAGACRDNPFAGVIPCHRVVAKNGIGGFMGQSNGDFIRLKQRLLDYESRWVANAGH